MLRKDPLITNHLYHIFNRGVNKGEIFFSEEDYKRFFDTAVHYKTKASKFSEKDLKNDKNDTGSEIGSKVQIVAYCLMPNHFHFLIKQLVDSGLTWYMQHLSNSYAHYIHVKYQRVGPLFEGRFKNILIESDEQLIHVSRYIHLNPVASGSVVKPKDYRWSSYLSFVSDYKDEFCDSRPVLENFKSEQDYERFVLDQVAYARELERIKHLTIDLE